MNPQLLKSDFVADYTQPDTSYFATSTKDIDDVNTWQCGSVNNPTPKDEILNAYAALWSPSSGADAGHVILYAASERLRNNGDSFMGFWLFQGRVACSSPTGAATPFVGAHNVGDVLILSNFTGGGNNPLVQVYVWNPGTPQATNPLELKFNGNFCTGASNDPTVDQACGAVNTTPFQTPWAPSNTALTALQNNEFLEVGADLTQLLSGNAQIPCFARFQAETRTSQQTTAQLKDFASGSFNTCTATTVTHPKDANGTTLSDSTPVPSSTVIHDEATVTGTALVGTAPNPVGTVAFSYCRTTDQTAGGSTACSGASTSAGTATLTGASNPATVSSNTVTGLSAGRYCFTATYVDTGTPPDYPLPASDSSTTECFVIGNPHLTITKTPDHQSPVNAGDQVGFTVNLASDGDSTATGVQLSDPLPGGTSGTVHWTLASSNDPSCAISGADGSQVLTCGPESLAVGSNISAHVVATTSFANCGVYDNTATFSTTNDGSGNASASEACQASDLHLTKTPDHQAPVNAGDAIGFTITLHNNGPGTATGAAINDPLPGGTVGTVTWSESPDNPDCSISGAAGSQVLTCGPKTLASGEEISVHVTATTSFANCGVYDNTATFSTTNDGSGNASASEACQKASIHITKIADASPVNAGTNIGFTMTVSNSGPGTAQGVVLTDTLPTNAGLNWTVDGGTAAATCSISGGVLTCNIGDLGPNASATVHISSPTTTATCGTVNNTGQVTTTNDGSDSASASITVNCRTSQITETGTTCQQFRGGTAVTLGQIQYSLKNGAISQSNPGVFFYWNTVTASGQSTFTITQTINPSFDSHYFTLASGSFVYDANCNKVTGATVSPGANGSVIVSFNAGSGTHAFFYGIKYSTSSVVGAATTPITYTYTFETQNVAGSTESILLAPK